ncbi:MAG: PEP-CTERM sorting domain-containing protein [Bryobacteraceae bacterium]
MRRFRRMLLSPGTRCILIVLTMFVLSTWTARAETIPIGSYYLEAFEGFIPFPGATSAALFRGRPFGPGTTDTIYQRLADIDLPFIGSSATIPIEVLRLEVGSIAPVDFGGVLFDMFIHLTPGTHSLGEMTITQTSPDDGGPGPEGIFDQFVTLQFTADFTPLGGGTGFSIVDSILIATIGPATWSFDPEPNFVTVNTGPVELRTNRFFATSDIVMLSGGAQAAGGSKHSAFISTAVPEPSSTVLLALLAAAAGLSRRFRRGLP